MLFLSLLYEYDSDVVFMFIGGVYPRTAVSRDGQGSVFQYNVEGRYLQEVVSGSAVVTLLVFLASITFLTSPWFSRSTVFCFRTYYLFTFKQI